MIEIVLTTDESWFSRIARRLGAKWTHALLRYPIQIRHAPVPIHIENPYRIIEAGFRHGVVERAWNPEEYTEWAVYRLADPVWQVYLVDTPECRRDTYEMIFHYAREQRGRFYAWDKLLLLLPRFIHRIARRLTRRMIRGVGAMGVHVWWQTHICSSLVDQSFGFAGFDLVSDIDTPWVLPDDFMDSPLLELKEG